MGTFVHLSDDPGYTWHNYDTVLTLGVNSVLQKAVKNNEDFNLNELTIFPTIYAANDSGAEGTIGAIRPENMDWISYFTHAKYRKWEAEGEPLFNGYVKVKHDDNFGYEYTKGDIAGWTSGPVNPINEGKFLMKGLDYWQYPRYTFSNPSWNPDTIYYKAIFRIKISDPSEVTLPVCEIFVTETYLDDNTVKEDTLSFPGQPSVRTLTTDELITEYKNFEISYRYINYGDQPPVNYNYLPLPGTNESEDGYGYNLGSKVQFKVRWLGNKELFVDYIEVFDQQIWENNFIGTFNYQQTINRISTYDQEFATQNPTFYEKLKYYTTMDEPGSIDCYEPLRKVQFILDSLPNINADLLTHWYPYYNGHSPSFGGDLSWPIYNQLAQPKKLYFWYAAFSIEDGVPKPRDFTLNNLRMNLQWAHLEQPDFYIAPQTFGVKEPNDDWYRWMTPDIEEVGAETMLALAHGVKGMYYELYYSYHSGERKVEELVDFPGNDYAKRDIWFKVQELASR